MAVVKRSQAEGPANGVTLTTGNTGGTWGDALDALTIGTGAAATGTSTSPVRGALSWLFSTGGTSAQSFGAWNLTASGVVSGMIEFRLLAAPAAALNLVNLASAGTSVARIRITTGLRVEALNPNGNVSSVGTSAVSTAAGHRLLWRLDIPAQTWTIRHYNAAGTLLETVTLSGQTFNGATVNVYRFGITIASTNQAVRVDGLALDDTGTWLTGYPLAATLTDTAALSDAAAGTYTAAPVTSYSRSLADTANSAAPSVIPGNRLNAGQQSDPASWFLASLGTIASTASPTADGALAAQFTATGGTNAFAYLPNTRPAVVAGESITVYGTIFNRSAVARQVRMTVEFRNSGGTWVGSADGTPVTVQPGQSAVVSVVGTAPATAVEGVPLPWFPQSAAGDIYVIDRVFFGIPGGAAIDTVTGSSSVSLARSLTDSAPASDSVTRAALARTRTLADAAGGTDVAAPVSGRARAVTDSAPAADAVARAGRTLARALADSAPAVDVAARAARAMSRSTADSAPAADALARAALSLVRGLAGTVGGTDAVARTSGAVRAVGDSAPAADAVTRARAGGRSLADAAPATDVLTRVGTRTRTLADSAPAADSVSAAAGATARALADSAPASDALARAALARSRALADTAPAADELARSTTRSRLLADASPAVDSVTPGVAGKTVTFADAGPAADALTRGAASHPRAGSDGVSGSDAVTRATSRQRALADSAPAADSASGRAGTSRALADSAAVTDALALGARSAQRALADIAAAADAALAGVGLRAALVDSGPAVDVVERVQLGVSLTLADTVTGVDVVAGSVYQPGALVPGSTDVTTDIPGGNVAPGATSAGIVLGGGRITTVSSEPPGTIIAGGRITTVAASRTRATVTTG